MPLNSVSFITRCRIQQFAASGVFSLAFALAGPVSGHAAPIYTVTDLGTLGGTYSYGLGINASGQVTGYRAIG